jgi:hypothetical protein
MTYHPEVPAAWFPGDGYSLQQWIDARNRINHPEEYEKPKPLPDFLRYFIGCDLGKKHDPSTVAVVEAQYAPSYAAYYYVKHLKRFTLRMLYTDVATSLSKMDDQLKAHAVKQGKRAMITYALDATGVGESVAELVEKAMPLADIKKVYLTGGIRATTEYDEIRLPKSQMVSTLVALFDSKHIYLTKKSREIDAMLDELANYEIHVSETGADSFGAFKTGSHDDLVTALALAVWAAEQDAWRGGPMIW